MKLLVKDLESNPFRDMKSYPINAEKLVFLKNSINQTFFWDNLLARKHPDKEGKYQIAYGHHRLVALKELKVDEIDIPVKKLDDPTMLKIMADENADEYRMNPEVLNETILSVKKYLDEKVKSVNWQEFMAQESLSHITNSEKAFQNIQRNGVGEEVIKEFLGPNWSLWKIRSALADLRARGDLESVNGGSKQLVDKEASKSIASSVDARSAFRKAVQDYNVPAEKQRKIAKKLAGKEPSAREVTRAVRKEALDKPAGKRIDPKFKRLLNHLERIQDKSHSLTMTIREFIAEAEDIGVEEVSGLKSFFVQGEISDLLGQIKTLGKFFGYNTNALLKE